MVSAGAPCVGLSSFLTRGIRRHVYASGDPVDRSASLIVLRTAALEDRFQPWRRCTPPSLYSTSEWMLLFCSRRGRERFVRSGAFARSEYRGAAAVCGGSVLIRLAQPEALCAFTTFTIYTFTYIVLCPYNPSFGVFPVS